MGQFGWAIAAGMAALGFVVVVAVAHRWSRAINEVRRGISALGEGRPARPVLSQVRGPIGRLARVFDVVAPRLEARIQQLEQDRQQLTAVLGGMAEGVIAVDSRLRLVFANASADHLFGLGPASVGRLVLELIRSPQVQQALEASLAGPEAYRGEITLAGREPMARGTSRVLSVHGTPLPGSPPTGAVLVFHDVTDLRRLERMRQDFVANASHELKTPLAAIRAYTETLLDWALHDESVNVKFLRRIEEQADRLNLLVLDLLSLARLESGQEFYEHGPLPLAPVLRSCVEGHRDRAEAKRLTYSLDLGTLTEDTLVTADEEAVRQIFDNLIDNAIKYTGEGGRVHVRCDVAAGQVSVAVTDTGIGIPRDNLNRVFERFYRVDKARSRELGGTGLGLSIVKHLVQSIGGQVSAESRVGVGSRFTVRLPRPATRGVDAEASTPTAAATPRDAAG